MENTSGDLLAALPGPLPDELVELLVDTPGFRVERIVSTGQASLPGSWYDQSEHEFVLLVSGAARLAWSDGTEQVLLSGQWTWIPAHVRHRVAWTDPSQATVWLAVFVEAERAG